MSVTIVPNIDLGYVIILRKFLKLRYFRKHNLDLKSTLSLYLVILVLRQIQRSKLTCLQFISFQFVACKQTQDSCFKNTPDDSDICISLRLIFRRLDGFIIATYLFKMCHFL